MIGNRKSNIALTSSNSKYYKKVYRFNTGSTMMIMIEVIRERYIGTYIHFPMLQKQFSTTLLQKNENQVSFSF